MRIQTFVREVALRFRIDMLRINKSAWTAHQVTEDGGRISVRGIEDYVQTAGSLRTWESANSPASSNGLPLA
jgi:hypothetical protein